MLLNYNQFVFKHNDFVMKNPIKCYKGFIKDSNGNLTCRGYKYIPGIWHRYEGRIDMCNKGFHACKKLYQCWFYYPHTENTVYYEVECKGQIIYTKEKVCCSKIKLVKEVDVSNLPLFSYCSGFMSGNTFAHVNIKVLKEGNVVKLHNFITKGGRLISKEWFNFGFKFVNGFALIGKLFKNHETGQEVMKMNYIDTNGKILSPNQWFDNGYNFDSTKKTYVFIGQSSYILNIKGELTKVESDNLGKETQFLCFIERMNHYFDKYNKSKRQRILHRPFHSLLKYDATGLAGLAVHNISSETEFMRNITNGLYTNILSKEL